MNWRYTDLSRTLSGLYYNQDMVVKLLIRSGLTPGDYTLSGPASVIFTLLIKALEDEQRVRQLLVQVRGDFPNNPVVNDILDGVPSEQWHKSVYDGPELDPGEFDLRFLQEGLTRSQNTLMPVNFLEIGMMRSKAVGRIVTPFKLGTGFLVSNGDMLLTNNHVIPSLDVLRSSEVFFNYQLDVKGFPCREDQYTFDPDFFETSAADDWSLVRVKDNPVQKYGFIPLIPVHTDINDYVNIIQHPGGEYKHIGLYHNTVIFKNEKLVRYLTDTLPGSSGSPVFNSDWNVVALHNSGGNVMAPDGFNMACNQGININRILESIGGLIL